MMKHERLIVTRLQRLGADPRITSEHRGHNVLTVTHGDVTVRTTVASSPKNADLTVKGTIALVKRLLRSHGVPI